VLLTLNKSRMEDTATGYGLDDRMIGDRFPAGAGNFLFDTVSTPALGPTQPPIQGIPGALSLGVKRPRREADHSLPSSTEVKESVELYHHSPIRLHVMVISSTQGQLYLFTFI
jgi:hypothetical protein